MQSVRTIDVATLEPPQRKVLEEVMGHRLSVSDRLVINVTQASPMSSDAETSQTLEGWSRVLEGMNQPQVEELDQILKSRPMLTRPVP